MHRTGHGVHCNLSEKKTCSLTTGQVFKTGVRICFIYIYICMNLGSEGEERKKRKRNDGPVQIYSDNLIPELPNMAHSCSWHGLTAAWLTAEWPDNIITVPRSAISCTPWQILERSNSDECLCTKHGTEDRCTQNFCWKTWKREM